MADRFLRGWQVWDRTFACRIADAIRLPHRRCHPPAASPMPSRPSRKPDKPRRWWSAGRGHPDYGRGTPHQLRNLGIANIAVLLPTEAAEHAPVEIAGIGHALSRLDRPDPPALRPD